ncbi:GNAT family N-acetyltransferase [Nocardia nova]|uniref:GNAT family N-acetyltransferase n=1 Tax=Nocardia nova TaxID=37330 RepID=UPI0033EE0BB1
MTESPAIEDADTDTALRKVGRFFAANISDVSPRAMGTAGLRAALDPTNVALQIRAGVPTVAAINSHAPLAIANGVATELGDPAAAMRLMAETKLLEHLAVAAAARGRGYARALVEAAERRHRADGVSAWFGFVDERERDALGLYEHLGFCAATAAQLPGPANILGRAHISRSGTWFFKELNPR